MTDGKEVYHLRVMTIEGDTRTLLVSDEHCAPFGFKPKDVVITPLGKEVTIMGVAPWKASNGHNVLWYASNGDFRNVTYWSNDPKKANLKEQGFRLKMIKVISCSGGAYCVDTSDAVCLPFGFKHGQDVIIPGGEEATIVGVAPYHPTNLETHKVLWFTKKNNGGNVSLWSQDPTELNLKEQGFKLKE